jgi:hypothetical protein
MRKEKGEEMLHSSFDKIIESVRLCLAGDPESNWIPECLKHRALVFEQQERDDYEVLRFPEGNPDRSILMVVLHAESDGVRNGNSMVFHDELEKDGEGTISALFVARRECDPFWFGLKASAETLLYERSLVFNKLRVDVTQTREAMLAGPSVSPSDLADFRRQSYGRLARHERETKDMHEGLIYRALKRSFGGALDGLVPKARHRLDVVAAQDFLRRGVVEKLQELTRRTFPEALSFEEEHARALLFGVASTHLVDQAMRPVSTLN